VRSSSSHHGHSVTEDGSNNAQYTHSSASANRTANPKWRGARHSSRALSIWSVESRGEYVDKSSPAFDHTNFLVILVILPTILREERWGKRIFRRALV
jgi:hypothetical protein